MKIAVAQTKPVKGDVSANIKIHQRLIELAISSKVNAVFFPELSLTGYEPDLAKELATVPGDKRFDAFQRISNQSEITIGVGMPTLSNSGIRISMLVFQPGAPRQLYSKQQLHSDELPYFENGNEQIILTIENKKIAPAICYESLQSEHSEYAGRLGADIYLASVAKSKNGMVKAMTHFPIVASKYAMPVLMSNCVGHCDNFQSVGNSAVWTKHGVLAGQLDDKSEGLLVFDTGTEEIIQQTT